MSEACFKVSSKSKDFRNKAVEDWLSRSTSDLKSAKVLYDARLFDDCVYHLQQSNEKLLKALLLSIGIMTPKQSRGDLTVKKMLGFLPKEPRAYGHRTTRPLISDLEKSVPAIETYLTLMENSALGPRVADFIEGFRASKKGLKELKRKIFGLIESTEQLEIEVKAAQTILDNLDQATATAKDTLDKLDPAELRRAAISVVRNLGYRVDHEVDAGEPFPSFDEVKVAVLGRLSLVVLAMLTAALGSFIDPLGSAYRYPDSPHAPFDENNPYIKNFMGLHDVISCILQKSRTLTQEESLNTLARAISKGFNSVQP
jgi:hypothetical protein